MHRYFAFNRLFIVLCIPVCCLATNTSVPIEVYERITNSGITEDVSGQNSIYLDICEADTLHANHTVHLTVSNNIKLYSVCKCFINSGHFRVTISDLRMTKENGTSCSPAELLINHNHITCDADNSRNFGSIFNMTYSKRTEHIFIAMKPHSNEEVPDKVLLTFVPEDSLTFTCSREQTTTPLTVPAPTKTTAISREHSTGKDGTQSSAGMESYIVGVCVGFPLPIIAAIFVIYIMKRKNNQRQGTDEEPETVDVNETDNSVLREEPVLVTDKLMDDMYYRDILKMGTMKYEHRDELNG